MPHYIVLSPVYTQYPESYDPPEPAEEGRDVAFIANAPNAKAAKWAAAWLWERHSTFARLSWPQEARGNQMHPLSGVIAERSEGVEPQKNWKPYWADLSGES